MVLLLQAGLAECGVLSQGRIQAALRLVVGFLSALL